MAIGDFRQSLVKCQPKFNAVNRGFRFRSCLTVGPWKDTLLKALNSPVADQRPLSI